MSIEAILPLEELSPDIHQQSELTQQLGKVESDEIEREVIADPEAAQWAGQVQEHQRGHHNRLAYEHSGERYGEGVGKEEKRDEDLESLHLNTHFSRMHSLSALDTKHLVDRQKDIDIDFSECVQRGCDLMEKAFAESEADFHAVKNWYESASQEIADLGANYGLGYQQSQAIVAAMSPRNEWEVPLKGGGVRKPTLRDAEVIMRWAKSQQCMHVDQAVVDKHPRDAEHVGLKAALGQQKPFNQFPPEIAARLIPEPIHTNRENAAKALAIAREDPTPQPGETLGQAAARIDRVIDKHVVGPKVRSFYVNLYTPQLVGPVTVDIWMVRALVEGEGTPSRILDADMNHLFYRPISKKASWNSGKKDKVDRLNSYLLYANIIYQITEEFNNKHGTNLMPHQVQAVIWWHYRKEQSKYPKYSKRLHSAKIEALREEEFFAGNLPRWLAPPKGYKHPPKEQRPIRKPEPKETSELVG